MEWDRVVEEDIWDGALCWMPLFDNRMKLIRYVTRDREEVKKRSKKCIQNTIVMENMFSIDIYGTHHSSDKNFIKHDTKCKSYIIFIIYFLEKEKESDK